MSDGSALPNVNSYTRYLRIITKILYCSLGIVKNCSPCYSITVIQLWLSSSHPSSCLRDGYKESRVHLFPAGTGQVGHCSNLQYHPIQFFDSPTLGSSRDSPHVMSGCTDAHPSACLSNRSSTSTHPPRLPIPTAQVPPESPPLNDVESTSPLDVAKSRFFFSLPIFCKKLIYDCFE